MTNNNQDNKHSNSQGHSYVVELNNSTIKKLVFIIVAALVIGWGLTNINILTSVIANFFSVLSPIIVGFCIAFVINLLLVPAEKIWDKVWGKLAPKVKKAKRAVCLIISTLVLAGLMFSLVFMVIPLFRETLSVFVDSMPNYVTNLETLLNSMALWLDDFGFVIPEFNLNADKIIQPVTEFFARNGSNLFDKTLGITTSIFSGIVDFVLAFAFSMYMLACKERLCAFIKRVTYALFADKTADKLRDLVSFTGHTFGNFITGQLTESLIIGVLCWFGMLIFRIPYAGIISVLVAFTALIPIVGAFIGTAVGAFLILLVAPMKAIWFVVFIVILQQIESNVIYPRVVGKSVGLPGILVLAAVTTAGGFFGIFGILVSVPVCSIVYTLFKTFIDRKHKEKQL